MYLHNVISHRLEPLFLTLIQNFQQLIACWFLQDQGWLRGKWDILEANDIGNHDNGRHTQTSLKYLIIPTMSNKKKWHSDSWASFQSLEEKSWSGYWPNKTMMWVRCDGEKQKVHSRIWPWWEVIKNSSRCLRRPTLMRIEFNFND